MRFHVTEIKNRIPTLEDTREHNKKANARARTHARRFNEHVLVRACVHLRKCVLFFDRRHWLAGIFLGQDVSWC